MAEDCISQMYTKPVNECTDESGTPLTSSLTDFFCSTTGRTGWNTTDTLMVANGLTVPSFSGYVKSSPSASRPISRHMTGIAVGFFSVNACVSFLHQHQAKRLAGKSISEMTYFVSSGTLNFNSIAIAIFPTSHVITPRTQRLTASSCNTVADFHFMVTLLQYFTN